MGSVMGSMVRGRTWAAWLIPGALVTAVVLGCGGPGPASTGHRTAPLPAASAAPTPAPPSVSAAPDPSAPAPGGTGRPGPPAALPARCAAVLTAHDLDAVLGRHLPGHNQVIRGLAEPSIGRTGRITCRYGMTARHPAPTVEVGLSSYVDPDAASQRVDFTVHDEQAKGAVVAATSVSGLAGVLLSTPTLVTLVLPDDTVTVAVSVDPRLVASGGAGRASARIGAVVLRHLHAPVQLGR